MREKMKLKLKKTAILYKICKKCYNTLFALMFYIIKIIFQLENKVVFQSFGGKSYSCNPRAISEELHNQNPQVKIVWLFLKPDEKRKIVPDYVHCVKTGSLKALFEMTTAKFWIDNFPKSVSTLKRRNQVYIYVFHGERGFKKVYLDSEHVKQDFQLFESLNVDLFVIGSEFGKMMAHSAFAYNGPFLEKGCPRCDILLKKSKDIDEFQNRIKENLGISQDRKILFYAPTLRRQVVASGASQLIGEISIVETLNELEKKTGKSWIALIRAHSGVKGFEDTIQDNRVMDVSTYEDSQDLILISDLHITDYSSTCGDFILKKKPVILFQADKELYIKYDRTFYFEPNTSPFNIVYNQKELNQAIQSLDTEEEAKRCDRILEFYGAFESGNASKEVVKYIMSNID